MAPSGNLLEGRARQTTGRGDVRLWAGRIADSFYIDLSLLSRVDSAVKKRTAVDFSGWNPGDVHNNFEGTTVETIVLAVSHQARRLRPGTRTGVRRTTKLATGAGGWRHINQARHPIMAHLLA